MFLLFLLFLRLKNNFKKHNPLNCIYSRVREDLCFWGLYLLLTILVAAPEVAEKACFSAASTASKTVSVGSKRAK